MVMKKTIKYLALAGVGSLIGFGAVKIDTANQKAYDKHIQNILDEASKAQAKLRLKEAAKKIAEQNVSSNAFVQTVVSGSSQVSDPSQTQVVGSGYAYEGLVARGVNPAVAAQLDAFVVSHESGGDWYIMNQSGSSAYGYFQQLGYAGATPEQQLDGAAAKLLPYGADTTPEQQANAAYSHWYQWSN